MIRPESEQRADAGLLYADLDEPWRSRREDRRHRSEEVRRRQWSEWRFLINPNFRTDGIEENPEMVQREQDLARTWIRLALDDTFETPGNTASFMDTVDVQWDLPNYRNVRREGPTTRRGNFASAGDRFDNEHVFAQEFYYTIEAGARGAMHANVTFRVLHDSAFRLNAERFEALFSSYLVNEIREQPEEDFYNTRGRAHFLKRTLLGGQFKSFFSLGRGNARRIATQEYEYKDNPDVLLRVGWTSAPAGAHRGLEGALRTRGPRPIPAPREMLAQLPIDPYAAYARRGEL
jgi:hypothetical protein